MNEGFDSHTYSPDEDPRPAASSSGLRGTTLLKSKRTRPMGRYFGELGANRVFAYLRQHWAMAVFVALLLFPLTGVLLGYLSRPRAGSTSQTDAGIATTPDSGDRQAKPAPGKGRLPESQAPPPVVMHPAPSAGLEPQSPPSLPVPTRPLTPAPALPSTATNAPPVPAGAPRALYTPMVYSARHDKVFGQGCAGQLTLDTNGLAFRCPDDPGATVQLALADIEAVDGNGVRLISGKKYHFSIAGMGRSNEEQLFANWLSRVR